MRGLAWLALAIVVAAVTGACGGSQPHHSLTHTTGPASRARRQPASTQVRQPKAESQARNCFSHPGVCGYPDPAYGTVGPPEPCASYPVSPGRATSFDGQTLADTTFTGQVVVESNNVTIKDVCVLVNGHGLVNGNSGILIQSGSGTVIEDSTIGGLNRSTQSVDWGVVNTSGKPATLIRDYIHNCGECIHDGPWTIDDTYAIADGMQGTTEHIETIYCDSGPGYTDSIAADHDTLLNPFSYVAVLFCNTANGAGGPCENRVSVTHSLLAGGGYVLYPCGNAKTVGSSQIDISDNRFARCTSPPLRFNSDAGGTACTGTLSHGIGAGADSHGYWPLGGYYGVQADGYCPPAQGQTWRANIWDDNRAPVAC